MEWIIIPGWVLLGAAGLWILYLFAAEASEDDSTSALLLLMGGFVAPFDGWRKWVAFPALAGAASAVHLLDGSDAQIPAAVWLSALAAVAVGTSMHLLRKGFLADARQRETAREARTQNLLTRGRTGRARVERYEDTGIRLGQTALFRLHARLHEDGREVVVQVEESAVEIANWLRRDIDVLYDPEDPGNAERIDAPRARVPDGDAQKMLDAQQALLEELNERGVAAEAIVNAFERLSIKLNEDGFMAVLTVTVLSGGEGHFRATFPVALAYARASNYQPGRTIWVRYDPDDTSRVTIDFEKQRGTVSEAE